MLNQLTFLQGEYTTKGGIIHELLVFQIALEPTIKLEENLVL